MISILISNTVATLTMIIMGIEQFPLPGIIIKVIPFFILTYLLHGMLVWTAAHIGNDLYFKLYNADRVLIINQNDRIYNKIYKYVSSHNKQYNIVNTVTECSNNLLESKNIDTVGDGLVAIAAALAVMTGIFSTLGQGYAAAKLLKQ